MKYPLIAALIFCGAAGMAFAEGDVIKQRQDLMKAAGKATKEMVSMIKGATPFDLDKAKTALASYQKLGTEAPALFPAGSDKGDTEALPKVWSQKSEFESLFKKLASDATAANTSITDEASFKKVMPEILKDCGACHETYRKKD